ncbi:alpha-ketoacid dehydrogenase subunit beta [Pseudomonas aeruginosa]|uniref:alpha-ketoacid dehydrogenase subunit beta n=1 Tax=Pseudomonas aeruginosa TaxID=287 RepID=UPI001F5B46BD|nr:alpha-ketoacid dehydrogenase subunit beta [Pseudomonas aeruginosa]UGR51157.2 alpha-ketoacid dehydrogenase subunit beta [Pseudomonas aeruginosa]
MRRDPSVFIMLERDDDVVVFGQDVGYFGGVFRCTEGLQKKYGTSRVFDAPISESGIIGAAVGMGAYGLRPVVEIQFADYVYPASDQLISEAARLRYRSAGDFIVPMTVRMPCGGGIYGGQTHSQSPEAMFTQVCGLRTVMPSNPYDAKGLLIACIENDDPVIFLEPKRLYNGPFDGHHDRPVTPWSKHPASQVPDGYYKVPLDKAAIVRPGAALTVLTYGTTSPLDEDSILESVEKTGRLVVVDEANPRCSMATDIAALVAERAFSALRAPIRRVTAPHTPVPFSDALEDLYIPDAAKIEAAVRQALEGRDAA